MLMLRVQIVTRLLEMKLAGDWSEGSLFLIQKVALKVKINTLMEEFQL